MQHELATLAIHGHPVIPNTVKAKDLAIVLEEATEFVVVCGDPCVQRPDWTRTTINVWIRWNRLG